MGVGVFMEPLVVLVLLFGGTWVNRNTNYQLFPKRRPRRACKDLEGNGSDPGEVLNSPVTEESPLHNGYSLPLLGSRGEPKWRRRRIGARVASFELVSPNTKVFRDYFLSRLLLKFPFLVEAWYWALIYWVYQLGRAITAVNLVQGTVHVARRHALQLIHLEQRLHIFWEPTIQHIFLKHDLLMHWINRIYSFIHIPGTIFFLVWLYYYTTSRNQVDEHRVHKDTPDIEGSPAGPRLYEARRRTMALCNLLAFVVFTAWPCMPPRLLSDKKIKGPEGKEARSYGFIDTVHGASGESSVWTQNRFCNQYAAMPSLHFGYALMIGLTVAFIPLSTEHRRLHRHIPVPFFGRRLRLPSPRRVLCVFVGLAYALVILIAIISTANHFILDAVAGACVCAVGWWGNSILLNLLPLEDYFLWFVRIHKPQRYVVGVDITDGEDVTAARGVMER